MNFYQHIQFFIKHVERIRGVAFQASKKESSQVGLLCEAGGSIRSSRGGSSLWRKPIDVWVLGVFIWLGSGLTVPLLGQYKSALDEQCPLIGPDQRSLYFTIANHPSNIGGDRDKGDIWVSTWVDGVWNAPSNLGDRLNSVGYNAIAGISQDGNRLYSISSCVAIPGPLSKKRCFTVSQQVDGRWSVPKRVQIPYFTDGGESLYGYVTPDEQVIVFSSDYRGSLGAEDIYVSLRNAEGRWSEPKNLGKKINTAMQEYTPWLDDTHRYLYFSSNGRPDGYGSFDLYRSERLDDTWTRWSPPINLGSTINSSGMEVSYSLYQGLGKALYVSSTNSDGYGDVKIVDLPKDQRRKKDSIAITQPADTGALSIAKRPENLVIKGIVTENGTGRAVTATVVVMYGSSSTTTSISTNRDGLFEANLPYWETYLLQAYAFGYRMSTQVVHGDEALKEGYRVNIAMEPAKSGTTVNLPNVLFEQGTDRLLPSSLQELDKVISFMLSHPDFDIQLAGHTDNQGIQAENLILSKKRVDRVKEYLIGQGVDKKRVSGDGYGGSRPIASNQKESTRKLNRRVEFTLIKKE